MRQRIDPRETREKPHRLRGHAAIDKNHRRCRRVQQIHRFETLLVEHAMHLEQRDAHFHLVAEKNPLVVFQPRKTRLLPTLRKSPSAPVAWEKQMPDDRRVHSMEGTYPACFENCSA